MLINTKGAGWCPVLPCLQASAQCCMATLDDSRKRLLAAPQDVQLPAKRSYLGPGSQPNLSDSQQRAGKEDLRQEVRRLHEAYDLLHPPHHPLSASQAKAWDALLQACEGVQTHFSADLCSAVCANYSQGTYLGTFLSLTPTTLLTVLPTRDCWCQEACCPLAFKDSPPLSEQAATCTCRPEQASQ